MRPLLFSIPIPGGTVTLLLLAAAASVVFAAWFLLLYLRDRLRADLPFIAVMLAAAGYMALEAHKTFSDNKFRSMRWAAQLEEVEKRFEAAPKDKPQQEQAALRAYYSEQQRLAASASERRWFEPFRRAKKEYIKNIREINAEKTLSESEKLAAKLKALGEYRVYVTKHAPKPSGFLPGAIEVHGYSTWLMTGLILMIILGARRSEKVGLGKNNVIDFGILMIIGGLLGARIAAVSESPDKFFHHDYFVERNDLRESKRAAASVLHNRFAARTAASERSKPMKLSRNLAAVMFELSSIDDAEAEMDYAERSRIPYAILERRADFGRGEYIILPRARLKDMPEKPVSTEITRDEIDSRKKALLAERTKLLKELDNYGGLGGMVEAYSREEGLSRELRRNEKYNIGSLKDITKRFSDARRELSARIEAAGKGLDEQTRRELVSSGRLERLGRQLYYARELEVLPERKGEFLDIWTPFEVWSGGLTFYGGAILDAIILFIFCRRRKIPFWEFGDFAVPFLIIGLGFGRVGCFTNGCCSGAVVTPGWYNFARHLVVVYPPDALPTSLFKDTYSPSLWNTAGVVANPPFAAPVHPSQPYTTFVCWFLLGPYLWMKYPRKKFSGQMVSLVMMMYAPTRFLMETIRNEPIFIAYMSVAQWTSILIFIGGVALWFIRRKKTGIPEMTLSAGDAEPSIEGAKAETAAGVP